jgi:hypothetical protein
MKTGIVRVLTLPSCGLALLTSVLVGGGTASAAPDRTPNLAEARASQPNGVSAADTFWCIARATTPFTLTRTSTKIYGEGKVRTCGGSPDACKLGVDLEQYNGNTGQWHVVSHNPGRWRSCATFFGGRPTTQSTYNCTHSNTINYGYRSSIYLQVEKGMAISPVGHAYSRNNAFYCF